MGSAAPRVLVIGTGAAGAGHAKAMRREGGDVVAIAGRSAEVCREVAEQLEIPRWGTDWRALIAELHPDVVTVATPGGTHREMCEGALRCGCHVFCDKPLATTAADARYLHELARERGLKTAFAEAYRYQPHCLLARELAASGAIGPVQEVECVSHANWPRLMPFGWPHRLADGGGRLNNHFTHTLSMVHSIVGGEVLAAMGEARNDLLRAPIGPPVHQFPGYREQALAPEAAAGGEWADVDSDWSYTALVRIGDPSAPGAAASAWFRHMGLAAEKNDGYIAVFGPEGTIHIDGGYAEGPLYLRTSSQDWTEVPIPESIRAELPAEAVDMQRNWEYLARHFLADVSGRNHLDYQTFRDGWIYQEVIDTVRRGSGWTPIPAPDPPVECDVAGGMRFG